MSFRAPKWAQTDVLMHAEQRPKNYRDDWFLLRSAAPLYQAVKRARHSTCNGER